MATPLAHHEEWSGEDVRVADVEQALCELREASAHETEGPDLRTRVMTHIAWVPAEWQEAALETLAGLAERHPSRAILLFPAPEAPDGLDARAVVLAFTLPQARRHIAAEVVELRLRGRRGLVPASIVTPLLVPDLPVFMRWRGRPPFGAQELEQLVDLADRLVVDSGEWPDLQAAYGELSTLFDRVACSDIAWRRTMPWRRGLASLWPGIAGARELRIASPAAEAHLLAGWLRSRLGTSVELVHEAAGSIESVAVDGEELPGQRVESQTASDLLSAELEEQGRDAIYEKAVRGAS
ncbi:MAG: glucose-6-phosphate dehydrogenase assembly protein OpcA [Gaiellaceae bacterium]